eukprot:CAMPEP_0177587698 /NCGR_PEP_ID=MMETSP0419_2-20121207/5801_1 /TAXON_ID=582737 /ORGANISM="Tetraselmis sp., Strain GSL018" /LENGTH=76 /DNA_ID=CAMNT_0019077787 /DNA_START=298 /DNA_END=528 /DNA_ORIENTATION=-
MVQNLLLQSPPGELEYVCRDLREIVKDDELVAAAAVDVFEKQNEEQMVTVRVKDSNTRVNRKMELPTANGPMTTPL